MGVLARGLLARPLDVAASLTMPGRSFAGPLPPLSSEQVEIATRLRTDVERLAGEFALRNAFNPGVYFDCECWLRERLREIGLEANVQRYKVFRYGAAGVGCANLWIDLRGSSKATEIVVVGSHYDAIDGSPAANDNGTGVAATLEVARSLAPLYASSNPPARTLRIALFANEEPPFFWTDEMGSLVLARMFKARGDNIVAMLTPETIGYYSHSPNSQRYPLPLGKLYPTTGDFIAFIGMGESRRLVKRCVGLFREHAMFPSQGAALPGIVPGVGSSDHWSFWRMGYPALMVTDTAPFRYPYYHTSEDTPDKVDFEKAARVVEGLCAVMRELVGAEGSAQRK